ncbi:twin-arginine translocase TatA/TatE family subunit [Nitrospina watsonii]|uniref:Sec-independent protein translocase protein TatA n=1 Tax=Nitrospina watsonii TaxID=1323948 RepID=A0ABM9HDQ1_9BACT|nr:twin-arginine translocase TatA/TatE family subunit [Nitrospina watsonii]CAI2718343.1 Sec-independent protein translocase protein TatA [Nitrospina watsonii]
MMGIGFPELMIILVIIMIIFGAGKLPQIGSAFGQSIKNFKSSMKEVDGLDEKPEGEGDAQPAAIENTAEANPAPDSGDGSPAPESEKPASPA